MKKTTILLSILFFGLTFQTSHSQNFNEIIKTAASDRGADDEFGQSVSISGDYTVVGAPQEDEDTSGGNTLNNAGAAYIFERDASGDWAEVQKIVASDRGSNDLFGRSVSISGDYLVVGAIYEAEDTSGGDTIFNAGSAYIFQRDAGGNWVEIQKIVASDRGENDLFGWSVSISGDYLVVGANKEDEDASGGNTLFNAGSAYIFERDAGNNWAEVQKIVASDRAPFGDQFGFSVSISGDYLVVGADGVDEYAGGGNPIWNAGAAYIFERDTLGNWAEVQKIVASVQAVSDQFGFSVSISGDYIVVGVFREDEDASGGNTLSSAGAAYVFERDAGGNWAEVQKIVASDRASFDYFGGSVSISGDHIVVGASSESEDANGGNTLFTAGSAYIFERDAGGNWAEVQKIVASDRASSDFFAGSVAISGFYLVVGASGEDEDASGENTLFNAGSAYIFEAVTINQTPTAVCQNLTVQLGANGMVTIQPAAIDNGSSDPDGDTLTYSLDIDTFNCSDVGAPVIVTLTVDDGNGETASCTATVTVEDNQAPIAVCQDITIQLNNIGMVSILPGDIDGGSNDNCGIANLVVNIDTFDCSDVGANIVTLTITDVNGNTSQCTATVTVEDNMAPLLNCPADFTVGTDTGVCGSTVNFAAPNPLDICGITSILQTQGLLSGSVFPVGDSLIGYTVTDVSGNTTTCSFTITVVDDDEPMAVCQDITIQLDTMGNASITANDVDGGSSDNCGVNTLTIDTTTFTCEDGGENIVTLTVTDAQGLSSTCTAIVTVEDVTVPAVVCQNLTVALEATGTVTIDPAMLDGGSTDECGGTLTYSVDMDIFDCSNIGDNTVTLTISDPSGNTATCTATVTVVDMLAPLLNCPSDEIVTVINGEQYQLPDYFATGAATATDNCTEPVTITLQTVAPGTLLDPGVYTISFTAEDAFGNEGSCEMELIVDELLGTLENNFNMASLTLYPNPANNNMVVSNPNNIPIKAVSIYDVTGRLIKKMDASGTSSDLNIDISELPRASYLIFIETAHGQITKQLVKE